MDSSIPSTAPTGLPTPSAPHGANANSSPFPSPQPALVQGAAPHLPVPTMDYLSESNRASILARQHSLESDDLPETRKRRKLSEYAHLEQLRSHNSKEEFHMLQRASQYDFQHLNDEKRGENGERSENFLQSKKYEEDEEEVDVLGSGDEVDEGHFVLQAQWQAQRDSVRRKKKRKSFTFGERRAPHDDSLEPQFSPSKNTNVPGNANSTKRGDTMSFGARHARLFTRRTEAGFDAEDASDDDGSVALIDEDGAHVTSRELFRATNMVVSSKENEDEEEIQVDDLSPTPIHPGNLQNATNTLFRTPHLPLSSSMPDLTSLAPRDLPSAPAPFSPESNIRIKLMMGTNTDLTRDVVDEPKNRKNKKRSRSRSLPAAPPPIPARRSARLNSVNVVEYEYDVNDAGAENDFGNSTFAFTSSQGRPSSASHPLSPRNGINSSSSTPQVKRNRPKPVPRPGISLTPKPQPPRKNKNVHGIVTQADLERFYESLRPVNYHKRAVQPKGMVPVLFAYQLRALSWMTERESVLFLRDGVRGGILADEMGLGKTIEMMSLVLANPRSKFMKPSTEPKWNNNISNSTNYATMEVEEEIKIEIEGEDGISGSEDGREDQKGENMVKESTEEHSSHSQLDTSAPLDIAGLPKLFFKCDDWIDPPTDCHDSSSTLIVCPDILLSQWNEELARHAPSLNVSTYKGFANLTPLELAFAETGDCIFAAYDVVLCSYETLTREFPYATQPNVKTRFQREQISTPLTKLRWWRIVMDEAQMFSQGASNAGKLLKGLNAVNRWAVSGTPVRKDFSDLKGLLMFLGTEDTYYKPTNQALDFIRSISWRHQMNQVSDEIIIPPSETHILKVKLSPLETFGFHKLAKKMKVTQQQDSIQPQQIEISENAEISLPSNQVSSFWEGEIFSLSSGKFASCPYQQLYDRFLEIRQLLQNADRSFVTRSLATAISSEFYTSQLGVCHAYNAIADTILIRAQKKASQIDSNQNVKEEVEKLALVASECYQRAIDLVTYRAGTDIHAKLVSLRTPLFALSPPSAPFSTVWYHTLTGMVLSLKLLNRHEEASLLSQRAESVRTTALQSQLNTVASSRLKFSNTKQETSRMIRNRLNHSRGEWWFSALKWIGENVPDFVNHLRKGVKQTFDTQFQLLRTHILQLNVTCVEDVIDKLDLDLTRLERERERAIRLVKTSPPNCGSQQKLEEFYTILDDTDESLHRYQQMLIKDLELDPWNGGAYTTKILNLAERLLLYVEYVIVDRHNIIMQQYRFHPDRVSREDEETLFKLARWLLAAEATFRELELMKIEVDHAQSYNRVKRDFAMSLEELESSALPKSQISHPEDEGEGSEETNTGENSSNQPSKEVNNIDSNPKSSSNMEIEETKRQEISSSELSVQRNRNSEESTVFDAQIDELREKLRLALINCVSCKHQLEFVLESGRERAPRMESYGTKISVVANKIVEVLKDSEEQASDPSLLKNKALVFSKWSEPLVQLATLLSEQGVSYHFGKDAGGADRGASNMANRLAEFRDNPEVKVFFLNSKSQSTGLTLTQANHVFLLEDIEPAHELQAIGRAHRIGQTRVTHIWKFATQVGEMPDFIEDISTLIC